ncbi:hypothetical protein F5141DRAFT_1067409 [Pisolithus sp. B1]|nr:hypothetical protein F5141DRAFT_1067409 [Pisolithus sp. B1]
MASSTVPTLKLDGRNWRVYQANLLEVAATKGLLGVLSGWEPSDESLRWEGGDAQLKMLLYQTVPISLVLKIWKLRTSHDMFDYLVTTFGDPTLISIPTKKPIEALSDNKIELHMAQSKLHEQLSSRAGKPLESEHFKVLNGMVKVLDKVGNVDKMAHKDLPLKLCYRSTSDLPSAHALLLKGEQAACMSSIVR